MSWPDAETLAAWWPVLGDVRPVGATSSGLELATAIGSVHVRRRRADAVRREAVALLALATRDLPVTVPLPTAERSAWVLAGGDGYFAYEALPGAPLDVTGPRGVRHARLLGAAARRLDDALAELDVETLVALGTPVRPATTDLPTQVLHRDLHPENVLFLDDRLSGYLDFDHLEVGPRLVDVAYLAQSLLARRIVAGRPGPDGWLRCWRALLDGYGGLTAEEAVASVDAILEVEEGFRSSLEAGGDAEGVALCERISETARAHAGELLEIACAKA